MKNAKSSAVNSAPTATSASPAAAPRRAGRRPRNAEDGAPELSRAAVVECAVNLAQQESLADISMVRLARELGVTPALIHYYMGSRDELISAVINFAFHDRMKALPPLAGNWRQDLEVIARATSRTHARWPGLAAYIATHNRFRLFQKVGPGETDHGLAFFDHIGRILREGGFTAPQAALAYHLLMMFLVSIGATTANRQTPKEHEDFIIGYVSKFDPAQIPGASFMMRPFARIDTPTSFEAGLKMLLDGFASWLEPQPAGLPAKTASSKLKSSKAPKPVNGALKAEAKPRARAGAKSVRKPLAKPLTRPRRTAPAA